MATSKTARQMLSEPPSAGGGLYRPEVTTPPSNRKFILSALIVAVVVHLAAIIGAYFWKLEGWTLDRLALIGPRIFRIADLDAEPTQMASTRPAGPVIERKPGAPTQVTPPRTDRRAFETAFVNTLPRPENKPPTAAGESPIAALPEASVPTLLPYSDQGNYKVGPVAPVGRPGGPPDAAIDPGVPPTAFDLPDIMPGGTAAEQLPTIPGGGIGIGGGEGAGALPKFTEIDKLPPEQVEKLIVSPQGLIIRLSNEVLFDFDSDALRPEAMPVLEKVAELIARYPGCSVAVEGHTDTIGEERYNQDLSERRAFRVGQWFRERQLRIGTLDMYGYGESRPIVGALGDRDQQQLNRRVDIHIKAHRPVLPSGPPGGAFPSKLGR